MRSFLQQLVVMNHIMGFSATNKKQGVTTNKKKRKLAILCQQQHEDDLTMDGILKPKKISNRSKFFEKYSAIGDKTGKKQEEKQCVNEKKKKPKRSVRFDLDRNTVAYRHATDEDLKNAWISTTEFKAIKYSLWSNVVTISYLANKNRSEEGNKMIPTSTNMIEYIHSKYGGYDTDELCLRGLEFHVSPKITKWKKESRSRIRRTILSTKPRGVIKSQNAGETQQNVVDTTNDASVVITSFSESLLSEKDELHALQKAMMDYVEAQKIHSKKVAGSMRTIV